MTGRLMAWKLLLSLNASPAARLAMILKKLTDMGVAFAKLLLICGAYCKRNPVLNPTGEKYNLQGIEERIKTGTIELPCYIP